MINNRIAEGTLFLFYCKNWSQLYYHLVDMNIFNMIGLNTQQWYTDYQNTSKQGENCFLNQPVLYKAWPIAEKAKKPAQS